MRPLRAGWSIVPAIAFFIALAGVPAPAFAAYTYETGETVALTLGELPSEYTVYWWSDIDGYLARGNPLRTSSLSPGDHEIVFSP